MARKDTLSFTKLSPYALAPKKATKCAAGYDLFASERVTIPVGGRCCVKTDIAMTIPSGYYGRIADRSGIALKGIISAGGVVDSDYRGNIR